MTAVPGGQTGSVPEPRGPSFFLVGAPKCGTTALHDQLGQHPRVFLPAEKETNHFATDLVAPGDPWHERSAYLALYRAAAPDAVLGDASAFHLFSAEAAGNIRAFAPGARILILLRDPVDWLTSYHSQMVWNGDEDLRDLEAALDAEEDRRAGRRIPAHLRFPQRLHYRRVAAFAEQVERYLRVFGREAVGVWLFEELRDEPARVLAEVFAHVGVDPGFRPVVSQQNPNKELRSAAFSEFLRRPPAPLARVVTSLLRPETRQRLRRRLRRLNSRVAPRAPLAPALRARLCRELGPEVERLAALLERDLSHWCRP